VLRLLAWGDDVERAFFAGKGRELPRPEYRIPPEIADAEVRFRELKAAVQGDNAVEHFLRDTCDAFATAARMLAAVGTRDFYHHAVELYGRPASLTADRFARFFPGLGIKVELVDDIASKAAAGVDGVRIKRGGRFSRRDLAQLEFHEGHVHVATALNGRAQPVMSFIGYPSPRTTGTQEGMAVLTEFLTQSMSIERMRRLADRTLAIKMAEEGADFCELYQFFLAHGHDQSAAYDCARRVCRGGLVGGGAPFTKDVCYLDGLLRVTNFLRVALVKGHLDYVPLFFAGKIDVEDVPLFGRLVREGIVVAPDYLPDWARDLSYLTAFMSYSAFLGECDLVAERRRYEDLIGRAEDEMP